MAMHRWISSLTNGLLVACALVVTSLVVRQDLFPSTSQAPFGRRTEPRSVAHWQGYAAYGHRLGAAGAPVKVVVFSDFQCPACRLLADELKTLRAEHPAQLTVIYRHAPLAIHPAAFSAAVASECAASQGRFEAFNDALFADQTSVGSIPWSRFAERAGVPDLAAFDRCVSAGRSSGSVARDTLAAHELGVVATPTFLVNGTLIRGTPPLDALRAYIRRAAE